MHLNSDCTSTERDGTVVRQKQQHGLDSLLGGLVDERLVDVRDDAAPGDGALDEGVELLVPADGELQVARGDALDLEVLAGVAGQLEDLGGEVLEDGGGIDGGGGADAAVRRGTRLELAVDATHRELQTRSASLS
jgi:hypothetical protein|uniref:Uncharacterized protein n=1 Tax=Zea mays TaxID=4577 RepID=A0A804LE27_MAIZE